MELVYKIDWSNRVNTVKLGHQGISVSAWSSSNIYAFTTENEVNGSIVQCLNFVNPNQPWEVQSANYNNAGLITCMTWCSSGNTLLTGDSSGLCCVWEMVNSMSNNWKVQRKFQLEGEEILSIGWFHHGVRVMFHIGRKDVSNSLSNFDRPKFLPSLSKFGGKPFKGCVVVTSSGKTAFKVFNDSGDDTKVPESSSFDKIIQLNVTCHQELVDISFTNQGKIAILLSDGHIGHLIHFFEVQLSYNENDNKLGAEVAKLPSLLLQSAKTEQSVYTHITEAKFASYENQDYVLACVSGPTGSLFEAWILRKENVKVHRIFQNMMQTGPEEKSRTWMNVMKSTHMARVRHFDVPSLATETTETKASHDTQFWCGHCITVACADNTIKILHRIYLKPYINMQYQPDPPSHSSHGPPSKKIRMSSPASVQKVCISKMCCAVMVLTSSGSMLLYKVPPWLNTPGRASTPQALQQISQLLLYCLVSGHDWWDVLLHVNPQDVNDLIKLLTTEVSKQVSPVSELLYSKLLVMKITVFHITNSPASMDCHLKLLFEALSLVFRSLNRPHQQVMAEDKDPAVKLQNTSCSSKETDINKLVHNVDTDPQTLQSLQQLIQWISDVALYLIASVPLYRSKQAVPGISLLFDRNWLSILREMLVLIRVWGLLKSACCPLFVKYDDTDVISYVFQIVTLLWIASGDDMNNNREIAPSIIAKCSALPMHVMIPPLKMIPHPNAILSHRRQNGMPFRMVFGEPMQDTQLAKKRMEKLEFIASAESTGKVDMLRRISLGKNPNCSLKECIRCGITAMYNSPPRAPIRVWDQRFIESCVCGGLWKKVLR